MILTVGNVKGGVGKTTLAVNLAIARARAGMDVLLIDGDAQATALDFTTLRTRRAEEARRSFASDYTVVQLSGAAVRTQVRQLAPKYGEIIIDPGARDTGSFRAALTVSDLLLVPIQPRSFDLWALDQVVELVREAREVNDSLRAISVLNAADPSGRDNQAAAEVLAEAEGIEYLPSLVGRRKVFPNAASAGLSVLEYTPRDAKAIAEIQALERFLFRPQDDTGVTYIEHL